LFHHFLNPRDARGASDEDDIVEVRYLEVRVREGSAAGFEEALEHWLHESVEFVARDLPLEVAGPAVIGDDEGERDRGAGEGAEFDLCLLNHFPNAGRGLHVLRWVDAGALKDPVAHFLEEL
jgi:hypothetical protein